MSSRHPASRLSILLLCLAAGACGRPTAPAPGPEAVQVAPLAEEGTPGADLPVPPPGAVATWTMGPPGAIAPGTPSPGGAVAPGGPVAGPAPVSGGIPAPTARATQALGEAGPPPTDPALVALLGQVDARRLAADVATLSGFGSRHVLSATDTRNRGIGAARDWLWGQLLGIGDGAASQLLTEWEDFRLDFGGQVSTQRNLIATLTGIGDRKRLVYLTAHYDSRAESATDGRASAPGADDDASGTAALLELARVLGSRQWDASIRLMAFAAEEPGQKGSRHHAPLARQAGLPILAVINHDIIGASRSPDGGSLADRARVYSAGPDDGPSRRLARYARWLGARYGLPALELQPQADRPGRGGDHQAFSDAGFAAIRLTEAAEDPAAQHNADDTPDRIDPAYLAQMTRLGAALAANLALAPPAPAEAPSLAPAGPGALAVSWAPVAAPNVAGYYLAWRPANEPDYREVIWVGPGTSHALGGLPAGRVAVALAAADDLGHASLFGPEAAR